MAARFNGFACASSVGNRYGKKWPGPSGKGTVIDIGNPDFTGSKLDSRQDIESDAYESFPLPEAVDKTGMHSLPTLEVFWNEEAKSSGNGGTGD